MMRRLAFGAFLAAGGAAMIVVTGFARSTIPDHTSESWSADEIAKLQSLTLAHIDELPADPSNRYASSAMAAAFGRRVFFDSSFSINGRVACATCHLPNRQFQDDRRLGAGVGTTGRRTMTVVASTYSPWLFWDGRADSPWSQALGPFESAVEHGGTRTLYARVVAQSLARDYERIFGALPDVSHLPHSAGPNGTADERAAWDRLPDATKDSVTRVFVNLGKSIEAFERGIRFGPSRFDRYVAGLGDSAGTRRDRVLLSRDERAGARLFIGRAQCTRCHSGALLTDNLFHNVGVGGAQPRDSGRSVGIRLADASDFNCLGRYSDASANDCAELRYAKRSGAELVGAFRTPSLRNVALRPPYGHDGEFANLAAVLDHYNRAPAAAVGHSELEALHLTSAEVRQLEAFLRTLDGPVIVPGSLGRAASDTARHPPT
ncbi:MAG TPA: cytochrome c peroxidase [Gemmatimonadaceae bacterium]|nr:cytochrome c peroxidase [Gemmatimonadaceae bacterium]